MLKKMIFEYWSENGTVALISGAAASHIRVIEGLACDLSVL